MHVGPSALLVDLNKLLPVLRVQGQHSSNQKCLKRSWSNEYKIRVLRNFAYNSCNFAFELCCS